MVSNGLVNIVGVNLTHRPINRFTFSGRRITFFVPARLVDSCSSQAVEFSTAITRCSRVHIQIVTVGASKMGDIFSLPATDTLRAFFYIYIYIYILENICDTEDSFWFDMHSDKTDILGYLLAWMNRCVLWYINNCRIFYAKFSMYKISNRIVCW